MEKPKEKSLLRQLLEFVGVYILSMFIILFSFGHSPDNQVRFYFSSLLITMVIFGAYEAGKNAKIIK